MQEQNSKESRDRSGPGAVRPDPQASEPPAWCFIYAAKVSQQPVPREWAEGPGHHVEVVRPPYAGSRESLKTLGGGQSTLIGVVLEQDEQQRKRE